MNARTIIAAGLESSKAWLLALVSDMRDAPLVAPTPNGGNHTLWVLGHVILSEASMVCGYIEGVPHPLSTWEGLFGAGSAPVEDAARYPSMEELLAEFENTRAHTLAVLNAMSDAELAGPSRAPAAMGAMFGTVGQCFLMLSLHTTFHAGQVADARRRLGRGPLIA